MEAPAALNDGSPGWGNSQYPHLVEIIGRGNLA